ncbi:hypothetical protein GGR54DRAFT_582126 [Hypoxylon sp. NC1633]|nr:hypothetical protein GGR54DRAFT_582126 [Hypoxylon sp. NC1633]
MERVQRGKELTPEIRNRICELHRLGLTPAKIHAIHPEILYNTIRYTIQREPFRENNVSIVRSKLTKEDRDRIYKMKTEDPDIPYDELLAAVDNKIGKQRLGRVLREMKIPLVRGKLTKEDRDRIYKIITEDPDIPHDELLAAVDNKIGKKGLNRVLREMKRTRTYRKGYRWIS